MKNFSKPMFFCLLLLTSIAYADTHCVGSVNTLGINRSGVLYVNGPGGLPSVYLCNVTTKKNNVETEACKAMYSALLAAKRSDTDVNVTFSPNLSHSCSEFSGWSYAPNVNWVISQ